MNGLRTRTDVMNGQKLPIEAISAKQRMARTGRAIGFEN
jgi:hypothetical protein